MPVVDLSEEDAALLDLAKKAGGAQGLDLALRAKTLHDKLYSHSKVGRSYQAAIKEVFPDTQVAADVAEPFLGEIRESTKKIDDFLAEQAKQREDSEKSRAQADFDGAWSQTVKDHELTDEGQEKLLKYMQDHRIADPEAAALKYFKHNPLPPAPIAPTSISPQGWARDLGLHGDPDDSDSKLLVSNPEAWADKEAAAVLTAERRSAA